MSKIQILEDFATKTGLLKSRGGLNLGLVLTRRARDEGLPLDSEAQLSPGGGQVRGLNGAAGDAILREYGVTQSIGTEVGRTNRNSIGFMKRYVEFLNQTAVAADLTSFERYWVDQFVQRFALAPFRLRRSAGNAVQEIVRDLIQQAQERQRESGGAMVVGTLLQHLVGAKLEAALGGKVLIEHHGANVSDARGRYGDFDVGDSAIHVTSAPGDLLMKKCVSNVEAGYRPSIVTTERSVDYTRELMDRSGLTGKVEVYAVEQFIALNVSELGLFDASGSTRALKDVVERYNRLIGEHETDPSLRIKWD